jgi:protein TonB
VIAAVGVVVRYSSRPTRSVAPVRTTANTITPLAPAAPTTVVGAAPTSPRSANTAGASASPRAVEQKARSRAEAVRSENERAATQSQAQEVAVAEQARTASEARTRQINELVQLAQSRIVSGALLEPTNDSARAYVSAASGLAPGDPGVRAVSLALGEAMVAEFHKAISAGDASAAEQWLKASDGYPIGETTPSQMSAQLDALRAAQLARAPATNAAARATSEIESAPALVATRPTAPAERAQEHVAANDQVIPESQLRRVNFNAPRYPPEALMRGDTGAVDMEFTVTVQGTVTDIRVTESNPRGVFERAAMKALARNRYQPVERDGVPVAQRAHIRMRFAM